ncbi:hypothetical protein K438DRAFT_1964917 [Mycena galopus ATCC 62051]|nr:hypothetical protein K438DRAFT_1964917 [Mycena galopus ATCC 62051]
MAQGKLKRKACDWLPSESCEQWHSGGFEQCDLFRLTLFPITRALAKTGDEDAAAPVAPAKKRVTPAKKTQNPGAPAKNAVWKNKRKDRETSGKSSADEEEPERPGKKVQFVKLSAVPSNAEIEEPEATQSVEPTDVEHQREPSPTGDQWATDMRNMMNKMRAKQEEWRGTLGDMNPTERRIYLTPLEQQAKNSVALPAANGRNDVDFVDPCDEVPAEPNNEQFDLNQDNVDAAGDALRQMEEDDAGPNPQDDDDFSDNGSSFSETDAAKEKVIAAQNSLAAVLPWEAIIPSVEEEDAELEDEYMADMGTGPKGRGEKPQLIDFDDNPIDMELDHATEVDQGVNDNDKDDEDDPAALPTPWDVTPGPLSAAQLKEATEARSIYHAAMEDVARRAGKKVSTVYKAVGDSPKGPRDANGWNTYQSMYRAQHPRAKKMTAAEAKKEKFQSHYKLCHPDEDIVMNDVETVLVAAPVAPVAPVAPMAPANANTTPALLMLRELVDDVEDEALTNGLLPPTSPIVPAAVPKCAPTGP